MDEMTLLQTQDSKFDPWRSEAEHATSPHMIPADTRRSPNAGGKWVANEKKINVGQCWADVYDAVPALNQQWLNVSCAFNDLRARCQVCNIGTVNSQIILNSTLLL